MLAASAVRDVERLLNQVTQLRHYNGLGGQRWNHYVENELKEIGRDARQALAQALADDTPLGQRLTELQAQKRIMDLCFEAYVECLQTVTTPPNVTFMQELWEQVAMLVARWRRTAESQQAAMAQLQAHLEDLNTSNKALVKQVRHLTRQADGLHDTSAPLDQAARPAAPSAPGGPRPPSRPASRAAATERPRALSASAARSVRDTAALELIPGARTERLDPGEGHAAGGGGQMDNPAKAKPMSWRARTAMQGLRSHTPASDFASLVSSRASTPGQHLRARDGMAGAPSSRAETPMGSGRTWQHGRHQQQHTLGRLSPDPQLAPLMPGATSSITALPAPLTAPRPSTASSARDSLSTPPRHPASSSQRASQALQQSVNGALPGSFDAWRLRNSRKSPTPPASAEAPAAASPNPNKTPLRLKISSKRSEQVRVQATSKWLQTLAASSAGPSPAKGAPGARPLPFNLDDALSVAVSPSARATVAAAAATAAPAPTVTLSPEALSRHARLSAEASAQEASAALPASIAVVHRWEVPSEADALSPTTLNSTSSAQQHHQQQQQHQPEEQQTSAQPHPPPDYPKALRALWQAPAAQPAASPAQLTCVASAPAALQSSPEVSDSVLLGSGPPTARDESVRSSSRRLDSPSVPCSPPRPAAAVEQQSAATAGALSPQSARAGDKDAVATEGRQLKRDAAVATTDDWPTSAPAPAREATTHPQLTSRPPVPAYPSPAAAAAAAAAARAARAPKRTPRTNKPPKQPTKPGQPAQSKDEQAAQSTDQLGMMTLLGSPPQTSVPVREEAAITAASTSAAASAQREDARSPDRLHTTHSPLGAAAAASAAVARANTGRPVPASGGDGGRIGALRARMAAVQARGASPELAALSPWSVTPAPSGTGAQPAPQPDSPPALLQDAPSRRDVPAKARDKQGRDANSKAQSPAKPTSSQGSPTRRQMRSRGDSTSRQPTAQQQQQTQQREGSQYDEQQQPPRQAQQQRHQQLSSSVDIPEPSSSPSASPPANEHRRGSSRPRTKDTSNTQPKASPSALPPLPSRPADAASAWPLRPPPAVQTEIEPAPLEGELEEPAEQGGQLHVARRGGLPMSASTPDGVLSLRELRAIIRDVFRSKVDADAERVRRRLPRQTLAQHLQDYISARTSDKEQAERAHSMLQAGISAHCAREPEVALFGKVLCNQVDEEFFLSHSHMREAALGTALSALQTLLNAPAAEVARRKVGSSEALSEQECAHVLAACCRVGGVQEGEALEALAEFVADWVATHCEAGSLSLPSLVDALLLYRLRQREAALAHVVAAFRSVDKEDTGVLDSRGFRSFCRRLNRDMPQSEVDELFVELDAGGHGRVTFSAIAACLMQALAEVGAGEQDAAAVGH